MEKFLKQKKVTKVRFEPKAIGILDMKHNQWLSHYIWSTLWAAHWFHDNTNWPFHSNCVRLAA